VLVLAFEDVELLPPGHGYQCPVHVWHGDVPQPGEAGHVCVNRSHPKHWIKPGTDTIIPIEQIPMGLAGVTVIPVN
jgi:hypothetical protein